MKNKIVLGIVFLVLGIIIISTTLLEISFLSNSENPIFSKYIHIAKTGTRYNFNFVDKHGIEKEVLLQFKKPLLSDIDLNKSKPKIFDGRLEILIKTASGKILYNAIIKGSDSIGEEYASECVSLILARYSRTLSRDYNIVINVLEGDTRYQNIEPLLIIRKLMPHGEIGFYFLFSLLVGIIFVFIGLGIIKQNRIRFT